MANGDARFAPEEFAQAFQRFLDWVPTAADRGYSFAERLTDHFGTDPSAFPMTKLAVAEFDRPNVQVALDAYLSRPDRSVEVLGFAAQASFSHMDVSLSQLVASGRSGWRLEAGPVGRTVVELDEGRSLACVTMGLFLVAEGEGRLAVLVGSQRFPYEAPFVEVMAPELERAEAFLDRLRRLMVEHNVTARRWSRSRQPGGRRGRRSM